MAETPTRAGPTAVTTASTTIKTAGGASTWVIVRSIFLTAVVNDVVVAHVGIGTSNSDTAAKRILSSLVLNPGAPTDISGLFIPLIGHASTPDLLYAICDTTNGATITLGLIEGP